MWRTLGISEADWRQTPPAVQTKLLSKHLAAHSLKLRSIAYQKQINSLHHPAHEINRLNQIIYRQEKQITALQKQLAKTNKLAAEVAKLSAQVADLKEKLGQNSRNSSLPPSSDMPFRQSNVSRALTERKQGAQTGHQGTGRVLKGLDEVDRSVDLRPDSCAFCGALLLGADGSPARRQVIEIAVGGTYLTESRRHRLRCLACRKLHRVAWTETANAGAFGAGVVAVIGDLTGRRGISQRDAAEAMQELFRVNIGLGSISAIERRLSQALAEPVAAIHDLIQEQSVCGVDETAWREKDRRPWLWVVTTEKATVFQLLPGRSKSAAHQIVARSVRGIVTTDRYAGYGWLPAHHRQICWAHLKRDFTAVAEREGDSKTIGKGFIRTLHGTFQIVAASERRDARQNGFSSLDRAHPGADQRTVTGGDDRNACKNSEYLPQHSQTGIFALDIHSRRGRRADE